MNPQLRRKLDHITDILWAGGVTNPVTYIEQISYLIFLKLLDEEESDRELRVRLTWAVAGDAADDLDDLGQRSPVPDRQGVLGERPVEAFLGHA